MAGQTSTAGIIQQIVDQAAVLRRGLRLAAGLQARDTRPIVVVEGSQAPAEGGESYYWTTPSGRTIVRYPNAYGYRTLYHASTRRVEVGAAWLAREIARGLSHEQMARRWKLRAQARRYGRETARLLGLTARPGADDMTDSESPLW